MTTRPAVVGGFILGALALGVAAILFFGGSRLFVNTPRVVVFFDESVAGLDVGAPVTFHGVRVGSVQNIALRMSATTMTARIPVFLELEPDKITWEDQGERSNGADYQRWITAGLRAQLAIQTLVTGQLRVDLDFRPDTPARLVGAIKDVPEIPAIPSDLDQLRNKLTELPLRELAETAQHALSSLDRLSSRLDASLDPLTGSARRSADAATRTLDTTNDAVRQLQAETSTTLRGLDALIADTRRQLDTRGDELGRTLASAERATNQAERLLASLNSLTEPRSQVRDDLEAASRDLAASASSLRNFAQTVERDPSAILTGRQSR